MFHSCKIFTFTLTRFLLVGQLQPLQFIGMLMLRLCHQACTGGLPLNVKYPWVNFKVTVVKQTKYWPGLIGSIETTREKKVRLKITIIIFYAVPGCIWKQHKGNTNRWMTQVDLSSNTPIIKGPKLNAFGNYSVLDMILFIWLPDRFITFPTMGTGKHKMQVSAVIKFWSLYGSNLTPSSTADVEIRNIKKIIIEKMLVAGLVSVSNNHNLYI